MPTTTVVKTAAQAILNADLFDGDKHQQSSKMRRVTALGYVGSTAVADTAIELFYGARSQGVFYNTTAGASKIPTANADLIPVGGGTVVMPNEDIRAQVVDAAATENVALTLVIRHLAPRINRAGRFGGGFRRFSGYRRRF